MEERLRLILGLGQLGQIPDAKLCFSGSEEEDEGDEPEASEPEVEEEVEEDEPSDEPEPGLAEIRKLRQESKKYRLQARQATDELRKYQEKEMSEVERANSRAEQAEKRASELEALLARRTVEQRVSSVASTLHFIDPDDAVRLLDLDDLSEDDDGLPTKKAIRGQLQSIVKSKPYLVQDPGSADGGSPGGNPLAPGKQDERTQQLLASGRRVRVQ